MKGARTPVGYTIIEVMIVLAVSGVMFIIAANFINGKQEATSFPQGVNELASNLQNTVEQVTDGQYSDINVNCTFNYVGPSSSITFPSGAESQGTRTPCVFLGKVVQFDVNDGLGDTDTQQYETFSLAGGRVDPATDMPVTVLANDAPTAIPLLSTHSIVPQHLDIVDMGPELVANNPSPPAIKSYGVGFIQNLGSTNTPGTQNGAQPINLYYASGLAADLNLASSPAITNTYINGQKLTLLPSTYEMVMCVTDHTQYAYIQIGSTNNQLSVKTKMLGNTQCT
jgi:hypothetical protein